MSAQHTPEASLELSLRIGQRVRHCEDFKGSRVVGVVRGLALDSDGVLRADILLDEPLVCGSASEPINVYRQLIPAIELAPFDDRDELIAEMQAALRAMLALDPSFTSESIEFVAEMAAEDGDSAEMARAVFKARAAIAKAEGRS